MAVNVHAPYPHGRPGSQSRPQHTMQGRMRTGVAQADSAQAVGPFRGRQMQPRGLAVWVMPGAGADIEAAVMARAAELLRERARNLAPEAEVLIWPAAGDATSGVGDPSSGGTPLQAADAGTPSAETPPQPAAEGGNAAQSAPTPLAGRRSQMAVDLAADTVLVDGKPVPFTDMEYRLLRYLVENCSRAISREELQRLIESLNCPGAAFRSIDVYVGRVRRKLGSARYAVATVRGGGYQFVPGPNATVRGPAEYSI